MIVDLFAGPGGWDAGLKLIAPELAAETKQFQQIGNAVPPLLGAAVLRQVIG